MADDRVFNALGATRADPCPTTIVGWLGTGYCNSQDYLAWYAAAADMYEQGINPAWEELARLQAAGAQVPELNARFTEVKRYMASFSQLPKAGSIFPSENFKRITAVTSLMASGDSLIQKLQAAIERAGGTPPELRRERPETPPEPKSGLKQWAIPAGAAVFGLAVGGIIVYAVAKRD